MSTSDSEPIDSPFPSGPAADQPDWVKEAEEKEKKAKGEIPDEQKQDTGKQEEAEKKDETSDPSRSEQPENDSSEEQTRESSKHQNIEIPDDKPVSSNTFDPLSVHADGAVAPNRTGFALTSLRLGKVCALALIAGFVASAAFGVTSSSGVMLVSGSAAAICAVYFVATHLFQGLNSFRGTANAVLILGSAGIGYYFTLFPLTLNFWEGVARLMVGFIALGAVLDVLDRA